MYCLFESRQLRIGRAFQDMAYSIRPFLDAESQFSRNKRNDVIEEEVIQAGTRLPPYFDDVFESRRGDQSDASAFSLEKGVRPDRGAVEERERGGPYFF